MILLDTNVVSEPLRQRFSVASRDERPFHAAGLSVINPWNYVG
jgi:predicted nucleic acid-binding protein